MDKKLNTILCKSDDLEKNILPLLKGYVFHVTSIEGFKGIQRDKEISNNKTKKFSLSFPQSENNYGRKRGFVCLFDLRIVDDKIIKQELDKYYFLNPRSTKNNPVFLILTSNTYSKLIPWTQARSEIEYKETWIPYIECWYPGNIKTAEIEKIIEVKVKTKSLTYNGAFASLIIKLAEEKNI